MPFGRQNRKVNLSTDTRGSVAANSAVAMPDTLPTSRVDRRVSLTTTVPATYPDWSWHAAL